MVSGVKVPVIWHKVAPTMTWGVKVKKPTPLCKSNENGTEHTNRTPSTLVERSTTADGIWSPGSKSSTNNFHKEVKASFLDMEVGMS